MILLDTHVLIWLRQGNNSLGPNAIELIERNFQKDQLCVSAITFWEIAMLQYKKRIELSGELFSWRESVLNDGILEYPIDGKIGITSMHLENFHPDPTDRLITATALVKQASLLTADEKILAWGKNKNIIDARK